MAKAKYEILIGLVIAVLFVGCRPKGILSSGEMRAVLTDLHKTDGLIQMYGSTEWDLDNNRHHARS